MQRLPEPELMDDAAQVAAYDRADFEAAHRAIVEHFHRVFPHIETVNTLLDLGCGTADIAIRFAQRFPACKIDAIDGAPTMLQHAKTRIQHAQLENRISLHELRLPKCELPDSHYAAIVSNSLLHHLHDPQHLWSSVRRYAGPDTAIFIADLLRPDSLQSARKLVQCYASDEHEILQRDFYNSLLAAFTVDEVTLQLDRARLRGLQVEQISDRHLLIHGYLQ